jgi:hypothetical protein
MGERIVSELRDLLEQNASFEQMQRQLERWETLGLQESTHGRQIWLQCNTIIAKALRFRGEFQKAVALYGSLLAQYPRSNCQPNHRLLVSYSEALCEVGASARAFEVLRVESALCPATAGIRLEMAVAHTYLMRALWNYHASDRLLFADETFLIEAQHRYLHYKRRFEREGIVVCTTDKYNYFAVCAGLAMIQHVSAADVEEKKKIALEAWKYAQKAAQDIWQEPGYSEMITLYSQSELAYSLGYSNAGNLAKIARQINFQTGRQFHFVGHGTIWLDILDRQAQQSGRVKMPRGCTR